MNVKPVGNVASSPPVVIVIGRGPTVPTGERLPRHGLKGDPALSADSSLFGVGMNLSIVGIKPANHTGERAPARKHFACTPARLSIFRNRQWEGRRSTARPISAGNWIKKTS